MATIKDIARLTGVSAATVSNVLNGKKGAAGQLKTKEIIEVADSLHYRPNTLAQSLKQRRTNYVGIITEDLTVFNTPEIVDGIEAYCEVNGYEIILANMRLYKRYNNDFTDTPKHHEIFDTTVNNLISRQVAGIIYIGYHCREISYLPTRINVPFVYAYCFPKEPLYPSVVFDDEKAAYDVTNYLVSKGHKNIGVISGPKNSVNAQARLRGFKKALLDQSIEFNPETTVFGDWDRKSGYRYTDQLLNLGVSAIFGFNDLMVSGVYKRCLEHNLIVGKDISLVGYDNMEIDEDYIPAISSVEAPLSEMGKTSAELIISQIDKRKVKSKQVLLPCQIHYRGSIGSYVDKGNNP